MKEEKERDQGIEGKTFYLEALIGKEEWMRKGNGLRHRG